jgi:hypothetical protein
MAVNFDGDPQWPSGIFSALSPVHRRIKSLQMQKDTETATRHSISSVLAVLHNFARSLSVGLIGLHKQFPDKFSTELPPTHLVVELPETAQLMRIGDEFYSMFLGFVSNVPENPQLPDLFALIHHSFNDLLALSSPPTFSEAPTQISVAKRPQTARADSPV